MILYGTLLSLRMCSTSIFEFVYHTLRSKQPLCRKERVIVLYVNLARSGLTLISQSAISLSVR